MPSATSASGDRGKKDRKEDKERKRSRGRSKTRERRSKRSRDSRKRHGDRRRRRTSSPQRHDSPQPPKPVLTPAAPATAEAEVTKEPAAAPSGSYVEEEVESESANESDAEIPDPVAPTADKAESEPAAARTELIAAARSDGPTANKAESGPAARRGETEAAKAAAPAAPPMTMAKAVPPPQPANRPGVELALAKASPAKAGNPGARKPPEPQRPPQNWGRSRSASAGSTADKSGKYSCEVCGRQVGGGVAGAFQHRKSGYHLAAFLYWKDNEKTPWGECLVEGQKWSTQLWQDKNKPGPKDEEVLKKKRNAPVPVRADPERKRRDRREDPGPDGGEGGGSASSSKDGSGSGNLLLQMWQATLKELSTK